MATAGRVDEAVEQLLSLEKKTRQASDGISTSKLVCKICKMYFDAKAWRLFFFLKVALKGACEGVDEAEREHHHAAEAPWF